MHGIIYQISVQPIKEKSYLTESSFYDTPFLNQHADYVDENTDREYDINSLRKVLHMAVWENDSFTLTEEARREYFKPCFVKFKEKIEIASACTLDGFCKPTIDGLMASIQDSYDDEYGTYVIYMKYDCYNPITLDHFMRIADADARYYIGNTIDYHY